MSGKRVLVTGCHGYVGARLVPMLQERGHDVAGLDSDLFGACALGVYAPDLPVIAKDIRDVAAEDLAGFDAVLHLAALSNDPLSDLCPSLTWEINHEAAVRLAALARVAGVRRFVQSSTCSVYGWHGDAPVGETGATFPLSVYAEAKLAAEQDIAALGGDGFQTVMLRHGTAYGASPKMRFDLVLNNLVAWAHTTGRILLKSDGAAWRPLVHVEDIAGAFVAALEAPDGAVGGRVFNIGRTEDNLRVAELAELIALLLPDTRIERAEDAHPDTRSYRVDCTRAATSLPGFVPGWDPARGIVEVFEACRAADLAPGEFEGPRYSRIAHLQRRLDAGELEDDLRPAGNGRAAA